MGELTQRGPGWKAEALRVERWLPWQGAYAVSLADLNTDVFPPPLLLTSLILSSCFRISATKTKMQSGHPNNLHIALGGLTWRLR